MHQKASVLAIRYTQALRGHLSGQTPVDNVLNDFESVNFIQSENVRCMSRYQNPSMVNLRVLIQELALQLSHHNQSAHNVYYVK